MNNAANRRRRRRPTLEAFSIQMDPDQSSAAGSLYEYNPAMVTNGTSYENGAAEARVQPFSFACELAQGSNQVRISGFANIPELYQRIAESFSIPASQIMYCTLDTPQVDMSKLLGNQLAFNHVIYAHTRGQTKEVRFVKSAETLGLTVSDNKAGGVFVKRVSPNGVLAKVLEQQTNSICAGDLIECINGRSFINSRHMDVVKYLKELPVSSKIVLRLISPEKGVLPGISKRQKRTGAFGKQTIRFTATGAEVMDALNQDQTLALRRLADTVEDFIGIADEELAQSIFDLECRSASKEDFFELLKRHHSEFNFPPRIAEKFWMAYQYYLDALNDFKG
uniref:PDZ domain-containing protein n=1 Tax=Mesocestoides corti TaxID=53468 RepID=A0A5K3FMR5_MESCO